LHAVVGGVRSWPNSGDQCLIAQGEFRGARSTICLRFAKIVFQGVACAPVAYMGMLYVAYVCMLFAHSGVVMFSAAALLHV